ncbi:hypothetical protein REPUB_Repub11eG0004800 [Reevesia pubescens]
MLVPDLCMQDNIKLMDDMAALRPTLFCSVPRLYNRIYAGILNAVKSSGPLKERLFNAAYNSKKQAIMNGKDLHHYIGVFFFVPCWKIIAEFPLPYIITIVIRFCIGLFNHRCPYCDYGFDVMWSCCPFCMADSDLKKKAMERLALKTDSLVIYGCGP